MATTSPGLWALGRLPWWLARAALLQLGTELVGTQPWAGKDNLQRCTHKALNIIHEGSLDTYFQPQQQALCPSHPLPGSFRGLG